MQIFRRFLYALITVLLIYTGFKYNLFSKDTIESVQRVFEKDPVPESLNLNDESIKYELSGDLFEWLGQTEKALNESLGNPIRIEPSAYGYAWHIYKNEQGQYLQFGIEADKIVTVLSIGEVFSIEPLKIGMDYSEVSANFELLNEVMYERGNESFNFKLNEQELEIRPLVNLGENNFAQLYFDSFEQELVGIRLMNADVLLNLLPYEITYQGELPNVVEKTSKEWELIEAGVEIEVFEISNVIRSMHEIEQLEWNDEVRDVAYLHSKDMSNNNYFSHLSLDGSGLKERLLSENVRYRIAGENIAASYIDAADATIGWLNSDGHRQALLNPEYEYLGVGVFELYYTQNFISK